MRKMAITLSRCNKNRVAIESASIAVDSGLIPSRVIPLTVKLKFTASMLDAQH